MAAYGASEPFSAICSEPTYDEVLDTPRLGPSDELRRDSEGCPRPGEAVMPRFARPVMVFVFNRLFGS